MGNKENTTSLQYLLQLITINYNKLPPITIIIFSIPLYLYTFVPPNPFSDNTLIPIAIGRKKKLMINKLISYILFIQSFILGDPISAQESEQITFNRITTENIKIEKGLSQNSVFCILQDQLGYIWFGTWDGLNKYDGYNFYFYNINNGLSGQTINSLFEDKKGVIWIGTDKGLNKFDRKKQSFTQYLHNAENPYSLVDNNITSIAEDKNENLWIGTRHGLSKFDKNRRFKCLLFSKM